MYNALFPRKSRTKNQPVKISVSGTLGTMLFCQEGEALEAFFHPFKNSVNGTQGTMLFSQETGRLKITQPKIALTVHRVQCVNNTQGTMLFPRKE